jgi:dTDP-4-dehydrorhamnose 3,5-epimerase
MTITETKIKGCFLMESKTFTDYRGNFFEMFRKEELESKLGYEIELVQENQSISKKGVIQGLHFQKGNRAQAKLVHVLKGEVLDVGVDLGERRPTYGEHFKMKLSADNRKSIFIPRGMANGFLALIDEVIFSYKCDALYNPQSEAGILYNDPILDINWEMAEKELILSEKDLKLPLLKDLEL